MSLVLKNNASTTLDAHLTSTATSMTVADGTVFPPLGSGDYFNATIQSSSGTLEIVRVTAISGDVLTITRAQEDTIAVPFAVGARVELRITVQNMLDAITDLSDAFLL